MPAFWRHRSAILCLVTDRLALARSLASTRDPIRILDRQVARAVDAEVDLVHVRERDLEAGALRDLVAACAIRAAGSATRVVVNDRLDVALAAGAGGVHLRGDSFTVGAVRSVAPAGFLAGRSVRDADGAKAAADADYLVLGTIFPTPSKVGGTIAGTQELTRAAATVAIPVLAIGGVSDDRLADVARAGAAGIAAIRLFFGLVEGDVRDWRRRVRQWRQVFDTNRPIS
jgi:thiamine-phosphate pyrophosphorylase